MRRTKRIAFIGEAMLELSGMALGESKQGFGGDTINSAVYCARAAQSLHADLTVYFVSSLGGDAFSSALLDVWQREAIDTRFVMRDQQRLPGIYAIETDDVGERSFHYWRNESAARYMMAHGEFAQFARELSDMHAIYISGISLAILSEDDQEAMLEQVKTWKAAGCEIYFDPNVRLRLWKNLNHAKKILAPMYDLADIVFTSVEDEKLLWEEGSEERLRKRLTHNNSPLVILKQGEKGCVILRSMDSGCQVPGVVGIQARDTTAAGDAFNAVFIAERIAGKNDEQACWIANQMAALVVQHPGAIIDKTLFVDTYLKSRDKYNVE